MKEGRSLTDLAHEIERQQTAKRDFIADTRQVRVLDDGTTIGVENQGAFRLSDMTSTKSASAQVSLSNFCV